MSQSIYIHIWFLFWRSQEWKEDLASSVMLPGKCLPITPSKLGPSPITSIILNWEIHIDASADRSQAEWQREVGIWEVGNEASEVRESPIELLAATNFPASVSTHQVSCAEHWARPRRRQKLISASGSLHSSGRKYTCISTQSHIHMCTETRPKSHEEQVGGDWISASWVQRKAREMAMGWGFRKAFRDRRHLTEIQISVAQVERTFQAREQLKQRQGNGNEEVCAGDRNRWGKRMKGGE